MTDLDTDLDRRALVTQILALTASASLASNAATAQTASPPPAQRFNFDDVVRRARELATNPFVPAPPLPEALSKLDFDAWRDIRFRHDKSFLRDTPFHLQTFHLGHLYRQPVVVNIVRDSIVTPIPYAANLFDFGRSKFEKPFPVNMGFAGFRLHYPLNDPHVFDEVIAFLGASYFRFLGRGQRYGISARAVSVNVGTNNEEFPFFREFWIETPTDTAQSVIIHALLDSESVTGALRFELFAGTDSVLDVSATLFPRKAGVKIGLAPLTSMFFVGENDRRISTDFRPEMHDSDGLLIQSGTGEWIWRPVRNPAKLEASFFLDKNVRGFGLLQRDRNFEHYQDLDLAYELRPSYWVEPKGNWGEGRIALIELPTNDESNDNLVATWIPNESPEVGRALTFGYRITSSLDLPRLSPNGRAINTYQTQARALGSSEPVVAGSRRFIVDFAGGDLAYYQSDSNSVELVPSASRGRITRFNLVPNPHTHGYRAIIDVQVEPGESTDLRAFLRAGTRTLTETWTFPWKAE